MFRIMMKAKLHRATVTEANLNYVGSITIDEELLQAVDILPNEQVLVVNNNNGARFETYAIPAPAGSRIVCLNGAAARLAQPGDVVIIMSFALLTEEEARHHQPRIAVLGEGNDIIDMLDESGTTPSLWPAP
ncbi:MAG: aspartate 1-decarboxylase [Alicyclobacillus sp.]|nr:aspartate 1-decarboxylase [Alicyclobacillus sp.]